MIYYIEVTVKVNTLKEVPMGVARLIKEYLAKNKVAFEELKHPIAFTAQEIAAAQKVKGKDLAKTVVVKKDGEFALAVVEAPDHVDLAKLKEVAKAASVELATEAEFRSLFPECELGAMSPLGTLHNLPVYADTKLAKNDQIVFNAGTHTDTIKIRFKDFSKLVKPVIGDISTQA